MELFSHTGVEMAGAKWLWHIHGRFLELESGGWPVPRTRKVVYHFDDECVAATEADARSQFESIYGKHQRHRQWLKFWRGKEVKPPADNKKQSRKTK